MRPVGALRMCSGTGGLSPCRTSWTILRRSEEHTSELQSQSNLVCRLLLEKKKTIHVFGHGIRRNQTGQFALDVVTCRYAGIADIGQAFVHAVLLRPNEPIEQLGTGPQLQG